MKSLNGLRIEKEKEHSGYSGTNGYKRLALIKVHDELKGAYSQVESSKEKQMISTMISTVGKLKSNPSYDSSQTKLLLNLFIVINSDSKNRIKIALFTNVDGDSIGELKQSFGF